MDFLSIGFGAVGTAGFSALMLFIFKESLKRLLDRSLQKNVAEYKHELDTQKEVIKLEIQKNAFSSQMATTSIYKIYPELFQKFRIAQGDIASLCGVTNELTFEEYNAQDIRGYLESQKIPNGKIEELIEQISENRENGIRRMKAYMRGIRRNQIDRALMQAKNFQYLNSIFCSDEVVAILNNLGDTLTSSFVDMTVGEGDETMFRRGADAIRNAARTQIAELEARMKVELNPDFVRTDNGTPANNAQADAEVAGN